MTRLANLNAVKMIRALKRAGFVEHEQKGSHLTLKNNTTGRRTTVPIHHGDLKRSLMKAIIRQAGISEAEFSKYL